MADILDRARGILLSRPTLTVDQAVDIAASEDRTALAAWHRAEVAPQVPPTPPAATYSEFLDPGALLMRAAHAKVERQVCADFAAAFAQAMREAPVVARYYNEGRQLPAEVLAQGQPAQGPTVERFRCELAPSAVTTAGTIPKLPIFRAGTWNGASYSVADLDAIIAAFPRVGFVPPVTLGHLDDSAAPAVGVITRLWREGDTLFANLADVAPEVIEGIKAGRWLSVSAEIYRDLSRNGAKFPLALRALAVLGAAPPGVSLPPLRAALPAA